MDEDGRPFKKRTVSRADKFMISKLAQFGRMFLDENDPKQVKMRMRVLKREVLKFLEEVKKEGDMDTYKRVTEVIMKNRKKN